MGRRSRIRNHASESRCVFRSQSGLGNHSAACGYTTRNTLLVSPPFPPISVPQLDAQPNGFQPRRLQPRSHHRNGNPVQPLWNLLLLGIRYPAHLQRPRPQVQPRLSADTAIKKRRNTHNSSQVGKSLHCCDFTYRYVVLVKKSSLKGKFLHREEPLLKCDVIHA